MIRLNLIITVLMAGAFTVVAQQSEPGGGGAADAAAELAKKLANPVAALISVPFQFNYDGDIGPADRGERWSLNIQPVVPVSINEEWNLISRTILPVIHQDEIVPGAGDQTGIGDIVQSFFFSPVQPTASGWIWGVGPAALLPTGSDDLLTADQWALGPTAVALKQDGPWTYGMLANHLWSVAGEDNRPDINATFLQPFANYTTPSAVSYVLNMESTYDWESEQWSAPVNAMILKVTRIGGQLISVGAGGRYYVDSTDNGPEGWGARVVVTFLFPK